MSKYTFIIFLIILTLNSCSTKKNTGLTRAYHNLTAYYNVYFNGKEAYQSGIDKIDESYVNNYSLILPVFKYSDKEVTRTAYGDMNKAIEKGSKCIRKHSITEKPKRKNSRKAREKNEEFYDQNEFVKWIDDAYLLIGKSQLIKHDYYPAIETFNYIIKEYSKKPIKYEAYVWLSRTYTEMEKYEKATEFLNMLEAEKDKLPESVLGPMATTQADIYLRLNNYSDAIPALEQAIELTKDKDKRVRYLYILAQLYQQMGETKKAYQKYGDVIENNPEYEMVFNARINRASIFNASAGDSEQLRKELSKMLKDDKNIDYRDQIYYALGKIAFNENRLDDALKNYKLSAEASTQNENQKAVSFLSIADIYFDEPDYPNAQVYYDSAVAILSSDYPNYQDIRRKSENLNALVTNLKIIQNQDSLQRVASMNEGERNQFIDQIIQQVIEQEQLEKELQAQRQMDLMNMERQGRDMDRQQGGKWYFYNPAMLSMGQSEFQKKWGSRKLEDNWRRKNKTVMDFAGGDETEAAADDSAKNVYSNKSREYYLADLPLTDSAMQVSQEKEEEAYFNIGTIYKEKFRDLPLSIESYLGLLEKFPETEFRLSTYYNLFKLYSLTKDFENAEKYKNKIIQEYPESDYAKILKNPDYFKELEKINNQVKFVYQSTYKYFLKGKCEEVNNNFAYVDSTYPGSDLISKFALLSTLCVGRKGDTTLFKESLNQFISEYPNSEETEYASEVIAALERKPREVELAEEEEEDEFGVGLAGDVNMDSLDISMYNFNEKEAHLYLVIVSNENADPNRVRFNLTNFNLDYYDFLNFEISEELLSADYTAIIVKDFKNKKMASNYFESVIIAGEVYAQVDSDTYRDYIISEKNYKKFLNDKNVLRYQKFFNMNYKTLK